MQQIDYKKVFSKLSHIKALSHDQKFDQIVQNLITHTLNNVSGKNPKNESEVELKIKEVYGISIRNSIITSNLDKLLDKEEITRDATTREYFVTQAVSIKLKQRLVDASDLEKNVQLQWFEEIKIFITDISEEGLNKLWNLLKIYLSHVFEQHGIQTLNFLNPNITINEDDQKNLVVIVESILEENGNPFTKEILISSINQFIINADEIRANYISQLADATFTSFALTSDAETVNFLHKRYNNLRLFLDTNFIFGILDLHKNSEDASAREILDEVKKNRLPFKLMYHPETLAEFKRAFDARALFIRAAKWTRETSRVAILVDGLSPLEELFHKQNIENETDPAVFLEKYEHVDLILKDLGLIEYNPRQISENELVDIETDVDAYQKFYEEVKNRKTKSFSGFKHDVVALREVRSLNPKKTKFLESNAFFISSDFILAKFERIYYKRNWEINYVVNPSVFLQLIRPFIENDYSANKRFIDTFSIPEFRSFEIDYSTTRSKALQIINDNYHATSFETKVNILRDQVLLDKLEKANDDYDKQAEIIESHIAIENQILVQKNEEVLQNIKSVKIEKEILETKKIRAEQNIKNFKKENESLQTEKTLAIEEVSSKNTEIESLNSKLAETAKDLERQRLENKFLKDLDEWKNKKDDYIKSHLNNKRLDYISASKYCIRPSVVLLCGSMLTPVIVRYYSELKTYIESNGYSEINLVILIIILAMLAGWELLFRTYLADKDKVKMGLHWIGTFGLSDNKKKILKPYEQVFENDFNLIHTKPELPK
ncbi:MULTISPECIES: hypothetical protein [Flavobacterium]|uniref:Uncharacterized protein n=2 Tax=Flavobacterium TaxID=237 RepID=A0A6V6ZA43_9FLAO|nr:MULTISPECIES: hypothetical protein [Flavobacterium]CAD0008610.1 hypothetical protein FLACHUCJ7_03855 [Flavobacterium chungangense]